MTTLTLERASEFANWLRAYHVLIDGERAGRVRNGQRIELPVAPGRHTVELTIDWCRSNVVEIDVSDGEGVRLRCGSSYTGLALFRGVTRTLTDRNRYLWLAIVGDDVHEPRD